MPAVHNASVKCAAVAAASLLVFAGCGSSDDNQPKNPSVIILSGDGMGPQQRTAIQYYLYGLDERQPMDALPYSGFLDTIPGDPEYAVTDSAAGATAWAIGQKVPNGTTGLGPDGESVPTLLDLAQKRGMATGLVNDHDVTNATLAAFGSPVPDRDLKVDIARGYLDRGVDVLFGGGEKYWYPEGDPGRIPDAGEDDASEGDEDLVARAQSDGYQYAYDQPTFDALTGPKALALVQDSAKRRSTEIEGYDYSSDPNYVAPERLVSKALEILGTNENGFFLVIESDDLDSDGHEHDAQNMMLAGESVNDMVKVITEYQKDHPEVLLIVTADHETGGMTIENVLDDGEPEPNSDQVADDPVPYWAEIPENMPLPGGGVPKRSGPFPIKGTDREFKVDWTTPEHTGTMVPVTAAGPLAERFTGVHPNTYVYDVVTELWGDQ
ncbi:alkaline phosphatase [Mycolicibacterium austroafricanum]|uniref:Alkaline phosphatase n=1 Tax=Mycolicibacterium austroafricanum TaxID=39687 RepID=A0ABT8HGK2_MYCAO|nr:alkaline phosphatase [Mycolicibacterium austroafricanum]MDN4519878.1 alkaline phosphatase [Mycolicibacterium austroafricanum]QRZ04868.1 alkaline phosphatase [Mycolicibacterium austroafricanum]QZT66464.1 alkaline phosphatase [Mycolicibacterium austroafricanum]